MFDSIRSKTNSHEIFSHFDIVRPRAWQSNADHPKTYSLSCGLYNYKKCYAFVFHVSAYPCYRFEMPSKTSMAKCKKNLNWIVIAQRAHQNKNHMIKRVEWINSPTNCLVDLCGHYLLLTYSIIHKNTFARNRIHIFEKSISLFGQPKKQFISNITTILFIIGRNTSIKWR